MLESLGLNQRLALALVPSRSHHPWVPVIIITGMPDQYRTALAAGVSALFEKPVEVARLLETMEELVAEPGEARLLRLCGQLDDTRHVAPANVGCGQRLRERSDAAVWVGHHEGAQRRWKVTQS